MKSSKRQTLLLYVLCVVLAAVLIVMYVILPMYDKKSELELNIETAQTELDTLMLSAMNKEPLQTMNDELSESINADYENLYLMSETNAEDADNEILSIINSCGINAVSLDITPIAPVEDSEIYSDIPSSDSADEETVTVTSGVYSVTCNYSVECSYSQLIRLIGKINQQPAMSISSISYEPVTNENEVSALLSASISISLFMH